MNWKRLVMMQFVPAESSFLDTVGYGMYTISNQKRCVNSRKKRWVFPCLGPGMIANIFVIGLLNL